MLDYIIENGFISIKICATNLGLGKTKSVEIFNKLIELDKIKRIGTASKIGYILLDSDIKN